jgi:acetyl esterase
MEANRVRQGKDSPAQDDIGADPQRLAVGGDSSGGLLAAWVAQKAAKDGPAARLQLLLYPNLDATTSKPSWKELGTGPYLVSHAEMIERYDAYLPQGVNRKRSEGISSLRDRPRRPPPW